MKNNTYSQVVDVSAECSQEDRQRIFLIYPSLYNEGKSKDGITNMTQENCLETCRSQPDCHSLNFYRLRGICLLSQPLANELQDGKKVDFYRVTCA